jgi:subtilase family serine protease
MLLCSAMALTVLGSESAAQSVLTRHVHQERGEAAPLNRLAANQSLRLNIALPLRNEAELDDLLLKLYDPQSSFFHQFLSVDEFTDRFGPSKADYATVVHFAEENGLTVTGTSANRMLVNVTAPVDRIERAFHVTMRNYQHPTEPRTFYGPDREPSVELGVPLWHITGLDNFSPPRPAGLSQVLTTTGQATGSGPGRNFIGSDLRAAYYGGTALTGSGQSVGLLEFAGYNMADVNTYFATVGQTNTVPVVGVSTDGSRLSCKGKCDDTEQVLDIEVAISMAPSMSQVLVYISDTSDVSIFNKMATDNVAKQLSCSWGWTPADPTSDDPIFKEFAAQGQNLFVASGDNGAYKTKSRFVYPADDAYVTSVGGTDLTTDGAGGAWVSERGWNGSGGGVSPNNIAIPSYQKIPGVITAANQGSTTYRNSPDVAAEANTDNYICYDGICAGGWGGTSFAAPRWAGYLALVNQQAVAYTNSTLGFINPAIYAIGVTSIFYANSLHDIVRGSNGTYSAQKGYDLVTGWGSPNGSGLMDLSAH